MDMADNVADAVEAELAELSRRLTQPGQRECRAASCCG